MIIGGSKKEIIRNIKANTENHLLNDKVEVDDPTLDPIEEKKLIDQFLKDKNKFPYRVKNLAARLIVRVLTDLLNRDTKFDDANKLKKLPTGAIITSNHFNPIDNTAIRKMTGKKHKRLFIMSQPTNLKMTGILGFFMNYDDIIPLGRNFKYLGKTLPELFKNIFAKGNYVLIYPEQEMWFNYRKPRPLKRGAYYYAAKLNVPIISCFIEMQDMDGNDNDEFKKVRYIVHILETIYPDPNHGVELNAKMMMEKDYEQKKTAYEKAYHQKLDYTFKTSDIAGWRSN
jgi:1-acyl-sn-glycerol-3-phosphate acyltransferase